MKRTTNMISMKSVITCDVHIPQHRSLCYHHSYIYHSLTTKFSLYTAALVSFIIPLDIHNSFAHKLVMILLATVVEQRSTDTFHSICLHPV